MKQEIVLNLQPIMDLRFIGVIYGIVDKNNVYN